MHFRVAYPPPKFGQLCKNLEGKFNLQMSERTSGLKFKEIIKNWYVQEASDLTENLDGAGHQWGVWGILLSPTAPFVRQR